MITRLEVEKRIEEFEKELRGIDELDLDVREKRGRRCSCRKRIRRWESYITSMRNENKTEMNVRLRELISRENAYINGVRGGRPRIYSKEEAEERSRERRRLNSIKYRERQKGVTERE